MKKINILLFEIFCFVRRISIITYVGFPDDFKKVVRNNRYGVFSERINDWVIKIKYEQIAFDKASNLFVAKAKKVTYLINFEGKIVFQTTYRDLSFMGKGGEMFQELVSNNDGTFRYISKNTMTGNGWNWTVNSKGQTMGEMVHFVL